MVASLFENFSIVVGTMIHDRGRGYYPHHVGNSGRMADCSAVDSFLANDYHYSDCNGCSCYLDENCFDSNCFRGRHHVDVDWISMVQRSAAAYLVWMKI